MPLVKKIKEFTVYIKRPTTDNGVLHIAEPRKIWCKWQKKQGKSLKLFNISLVIAIYYNSIIHYGVIHIKTVTNIHIKR